MDSTDTQTRLETLERDLQRNRPRITDRLDRCAPPRQPPSSRHSSWSTRRATTARTLPRAPVDTRAATELASDFMDAPRGVRRGPRSVVPRGRRRHPAPRPPPWTPQSMGPHLRWTRAIGFRLLPGRCEPESVSAPATTVACAYDVHGLGSERLGRGPFTDNVLRLTVVDGEIVSGVEEWGSDAFEVTMWEPFTAWLLSNHVDDSDFMFADWPGGDAARVDRTLREAVGEERRPVRRGRRTRGRPPRWRRR